jgi:N-acetylglucosamine-6-sulfatase
MRNDVLFLFSIFARTVVFLGVTLALHAAQIGAVSQPNVLFVLCDDLRPDALGCGSKYVKTLALTAGAGRCALRHSILHHLPLLAKRCSILTGLCEPSWRADNFAELPSACRGPGRLRIGYRTAYIGKWHMGRTMTPQPGLTGLSLKRPGKLRYGVNFNTRREIVKGYYKKWLPTWRWTGCGKRKRKTLGAVHRS